MNIEEDKQIFLACGPTDMRKSIDGLSAIVAQSFALDPCSRAIFIFCNRRRNRFKMLEWDGDGFWLHFKRLENTRLLWPALTNRNQIMEMTKGELSVLLKSPSLEQKIEYKKLDHMVVC